MRNEASSAPAVQRDQRAILLAPAEPRGGERRRRRAPESRSSLAREWRISIAPTPKKNGSPLASTQTGSPRRAKIASNASLDRRGPDERFAAIGAASARCRAAADDEGGLRDEAPRGRRKAVVPSSPMPTIESQRSRVTEPPLEAALRLLILGGTSEASALRAALAERPKYRRDPVARRARPSIRRARRSQRGPGASAAPLACAPILRPSASKP